MSQIRNNVMDRNNVLLESYSYDATGNRLNKVSINPTATGPYVYQASGHRLHTTGTIDGSESMTTSTLRTRQYDAAGNATADVVVDIHGSGNFYGYDARNRMVSADGKEPMGNQWGQV